MMMLPKTNRLEANLEKARKDLLQAVEGLALLRERQRLIEEFHPPLLALAQGLLRVAKIQSDLLQSAFFSEKHSYTEPLALFDIADELLKRIVDSGLPITAQGAREQGYEINGLDKWLPKPDDHAK